MDKFSFLIFISVQALFSWRPEDMTNPKPSFFSFKSIVENPKLKVSMTLSCSSWVNICNISWGSQHLLVFSWCEYGTVFSIVYTVVIQSCYSVCSSTVKYIYCRKKSEIQGWVAIYYRLILMYTPVLKLALQGLIYRTLMFLLW